MRTAALLEDAMWNMEQQLEMWRIENPGKKPIRLDASVSGQPMHGAPLAAMQAAVAQLGCKGTFPGGAPSGGSNTLREAAARERAGQGVSISADEIFAFPGTQAALAALLGLAAPGARVLLPALPEPSHLRAVELAGHRASIVRAGEKRGFLALPESIAQRRAAPDSILLASPSSVSGAAYSREQLAQWTEYAARTGALLIVDTTYSMALEGKCDGVLQGTAARGCVVELRSLNGAEGFCAAPCTLVYVAKELAPGGLALHGQLAARAARADGIAHPVDRAATAFLEAGGGLGSGSVGWKASAALLASALTEQGAHFLGGTASPFFWVRCPAGYQGDSRRFFGDLLQNCGTVCVPGAAFGKAGEGWFRLSALCDQAAAEIAMKRMKQSFRFM